jgi:hypothetical protein
MAEESESGARLRHPNRERPGAKATKTVVATLLVASAVLILIVLIGGWTVQAGARWVTALYVIVYLVMAYYVLKWKRGVLAMAAGLSLLFAIVLAPGLPLIFERTKEGYAVSLIPAEILGLLMVLILVLQVLLVVATMVGFNQGWNLEIEERQEEEEDDYYYEDEEGSYEDYEYEEEETGEQPVAAGSSGGEEEQSGAASEEDDSGGGSQGQQRT